MFLAFGNLMKPLHSSLKYFLNHFQFKVFPKCCHILKGFKAFQSSSNCFKYSEKKICFSHGYWYNLHLLSNSSPAKTWLSTRTRISRSTLISLWWRKFFRIDWASVSITWNRGKFADVLTSKILKRTWLLAQEPRLVTYATEISLLRSLVASQQ